MTDKENGTDGIEGVRRGLIGIATVSLSDAGRFGRLDPSFFMTVGFAEARSMSDEALFAKANDILAKVSGAEAEMIVSVIREAAKRGPYVDRYIAENDEVEKALKSGKIPGRTQEKRRSVAAGIIGAYKFMVESPSFIEELSRERGEAEKKVRAADRIAREIVGPG